MTLSSGFKMYESRIILGRNYFAWTSNGNEGLVEGLGGSMQYEVGVCRPGRCVCVCVQHRRICAEAACLATRSWPIPVAHAVSPFFSSANS